MEVSKGRVGFLLLSGTVAAALVLALGAMYVPAGGQPPGAQRDGPSSSSRAADFEGWLRADPETGCFEVPPEQGEGPQVVPAEDVDPVQEGSSGDLLEWLQDPPDDAQAPRPSMPGPPLHAEPWPTCDGQPDAMPVGQAPEAAVGAHEG